MYDIENRLNDIIFKYNLDEFYPNYRKALIAKKILSSIIVLGENKVLEIGSHEELMKLRGNYYQMYNVQSEYYKEVGR